MKTFSPAFFLSIAANLFPLFGISVLNWNSSIVITTYWVELTVLPVWLFLQMRFAMREKTVFNIEVNDIPLNQLSLGQQKHFASFFIPLFFIIFAVITGSFTLFQLTPVSSTGTTTSYEIGPLLFSLSTLLIPFVYYHLSYGTYFFHEYLGTGENLNANPIERIIPAILHLVPIFGGIFFIIIYSAPTALWFIIIVKTLGDLIAQVWGKKIMEAFRQRSMNLEPIPTNT